MSTYSPACHSTRWVFPASSTTSYSTTPSPKASNPSPKPYCLYVYRLMFHHPPLFYHFFVFFQSMPWLSHCPNNFSPSSNKAPPNCQLPPWSSNTRRCINWQRNMDPLSASPGYSAPPRWALRRTERTGPFRKATRTSWSPSTRRPTACTSSTRWRCWACRCAGGRKL